MPDADAAHTMQAPDCIGHVRVLSVDATDLLGEVRVYATLHRRGSVPLNDEDASPDLRVTLSDGVHAYAIVLSGIAFGLESGTQSIAAPTTREVSMGVGAGRVPDDELLAIETWWAGAGDVVRIKREQGGLVIYRQPFDEQASSFPRKKLVRIRLAEGATVRAAN